MKDNETLSVSLRSLDFINLMAYDLNGAWDDVTGHNAPLYARTAEKGTERETLNVVSTMMICCDNATVLSYFLHAWCILFILLSSKQL